MSRVALTTIDNPYNPFTDFKSWFLYDVTNGYNSCSYLGRVARTSDKFTDDENEEEIERAIDEIVDLDLTGNYIKLVDKETKK